jgi:hypothetical protein
MQEKSSKFGVAASQSFQDLCIAAVGTIESSRTNNDPVRPQAENESEIPATRNVRICRAERIHFSAQRSRKEVEA